MVESQPVKQYMMSQIGNVDRPQKQQRTIFQQNIRLDQKGKQIASTSSDDIARASHGAKVQAAHPHHPQSSDHNLYDLCDNK